MRTLVIEDIRKVKIIDRPDETRKEGEALLKLLYGGICGSDLGSYRGAFAYFEYPRIPGHEFSAEVIDVDENNPYGIKKGMIVTGNPYYNCGECYACKKGHPNCCENMKCLGCQWDGAFSTYFSMPLERIFDGRGASAKTLAAVEPYCVSSHGIKRANVQKGDKVLVVGAGTIGMFAMKAAKLRGAEVTVCDVSQKKLEFALERGADHILLNSSEEAFSKGVKELTDGNGFDVTVECVGRASTMQNCIDAVCYHGTVLDIGVSKQNLDFFYTIIQKKELTILGSRNALDEDFRETIDALEAGTLTLEDVVTNVYPFEEAATAFKDFDEHQGEMLKTLLEF